MPVRWCRDRFPILSPASRSSPMESDRFPEIPESIHLTSSRVGADSSITSIAAIYSWSSHGSAGSGNSSQMVTLTRSCSARAARTSAELHPHRRRTACPWRIPKSCGDWSLIQPSTMSAPAVGIEIDRWVRSVRYLFWQASLQPAMRSMAVIVTLELG